MPTSAPLWASCSSPIPRQACPRWAGTDSSAAWQLAALLVWHFAVQCVWYSLRPACLRACLACSACLPCSGAWRCLLRMAAWWSRRGWPPSSCRSAWVGGWLADWWVGGRAGGWLTGGVDGWVVVALEMGWDGLLTCPPTCPSAHPRTHSPARLPAGLQRWGLRSSRHGWPTRSAGPWRWSWQGGCRS